MKINKEKHRKIMFNILRDIYTWELSKYLVFKGGTACYFLHKLDRFSTDLDFDLIDDSINIDTKMIEILKKYWEVKIGKYNIKLSYWELDVNIKIDINRNIWKSNIYENINFFWIDIKVHDKSTIFANKLVALTERNTNRDIYDVFFFIQQNFDINEDVILERTGWNKIDLFKNIILKLNKLWDNYKILDGLWEVLDEKQKLFMKNNLVNSLVQELEFQINFNDS